MSKGELMLNRCVILQALLCALAVSVASADDWRQFRGNAANGVADDDDVPTNLSGEKIAWIAELPGRGLSGAIVVGDRVIVSASSGFRQDRLHVLCFDEDSGEKLWERQFWATGRTMCHRKMCVATPTPASDGKRIFAFYSSNDLVCLDLDGNLLWYRGLTHDYPNASNSLGMASSPVVVDDTLVVQVESDAESFAAGIDVEDGSQRWKVDRPRRANWSSPTILDRDLVVLQSSAGIDVIRPRTGKTVWSFDKGASTIPSSTVEGDILYVPSNGLTALRAPEEGSNAEVVWNVGRLNPSTSSPLVVDGRSFTLNGAGVLACADVETGDLQWQLRLKGPFSASPVAANGHLYFVNEAGFAQVVRIGDDKGEIVSELDFAETILGTPAISDGAIYLRSDQHLWKLSDD